MKLALPPRVPFEEILVFTQNLSTMVKAGVSLGEALPALSHNTEQKTMRRVLIDVAGRVEKGGTLSESLARYPKIFPVLYTSLIEVGEQSGRLSEVLSQLFLQLKKTHDLRAKVRGALIYPTFVVSAMIVIGTLMLIFVVPKITVIFSDVNVTLPLPTRILISVSHFFQNHALLILAGLPVLVIGLILLARQPPVRFRLHQFFLVLPIFGSIAKKINLAAFTRTLSSLIKTDLPIVQSFKLTAPTLGNVLYQQALTASESRLAKGETMAAILNDWPRLFPPLVIQMISTGEKSGSLDSILEETADFYERQVSEIMTNLPSLLEPILIILLGIGVAGIALAIMMPMYSLTQAF